MTSTATYHSLVDRVVIVTGGGQGLGRSYALHFAEQGAIPVVADLNGETASRVAAEIIEAGGRALAVETDVADEASTKQMAAAALEAFGRIDCLVNNAALFSQITMGPFWELPIEEWERAVRINVTGAFLCARAVVPAMRDANWGRIVNICTTSVPAGVPNYLHYITSKSALIGMTRSMARELGTSNVTVNLLYPGAVETETERNSVKGDRFDRLAKMQALPRRADMEDIARCVLFLCSEEGAFVTGQGLMANGGFAFI